MDSPSVPQSPLTLADIRVTHTVGSRRLVRPGATLAKLIQATEHLYDPDNLDGEYLDFLCPSAIAMELKGLAETLCVVAESEEEGAASRCVPYMADQLRRIAHRVSALAPTSANQAPDWYKVEVTT